MKNDLPPLLSRVGGHIEVIAQLDDYQVAND